MTKKEKVANNRRLGQIWMEIRAYKNASKTRSSGSSWPEIQSKYQEFVKNNEGLCLAIESAYPKSVDQLKELKYPNDIDKTIAALNAVIPSDEG
ncbi:hypothetical protein KFE94_17300 [bacterium SCSIO 12643]|nr:hypothetical protein KFE94_17300 [bacterium SCSIO 12643]